jgi:CAF1 family ribonuclease
MYRIFETLRRVCGGLLPLPSNHVLFATSFGGVDWNNQLELLEQERQKEAAGGVGGRKVPLIVHNGYMDLLFLLTHFHSQPLPHSYLEMKRLLHAYFPVIYDTKALATEGRLSSYKNDNTGLSSLYELIVNGFASLKTSIWVVPPMGASTIEDNGDTQQHEAAYDAYMTGVIFLGLCQDIRKKQRRLPSSTAKMLPLLPGFQNSLQADEERIFVPNKIFQMNSIFILDLSLSTAKDPLSRISSTTTSYRVSGIDPSVATRDIVRCLSSLRDPQTGKEVQYDIIWVDISTFIVATKFEPPEVIVVDEEDEEEEGQVEEDLPVPQHMPDEELNRILGQHGSLVYEALKNRFKTQTIVTLEDHLKAVLPSVDSSLNTSGGSFVEWLGKLWSSIVGTGKRPAVDVEGASANGNSMGQRQSKRQRIG